MSHCANIKRIMNENNHPILQPIEQTRLILAAALVATAVAAIQILPSFPDGLFEVLVKCIFAISAISGFLFIILTAATLKSSKVDEVGGWPFTEKFRMRCYDYCINSYGIQIGSVIVLSCAYLFGWTFKSGVLDWRVGVGVLLVLLFSALAIYVVRFRRRQ